MNAATRLLIAGFLFAGAAIGADLTGIWMGETTGRNGEKQDLAFRFQSTNGVITGVMFGDEFDLPVQDLRIEGNKVTFTVTSINFYDGRQIKSAFAGSVTATKLELTREQTGGNAKETKQTLTLKRLG